MNKSLYEKVRSPLSIEEREAIEKQLEFGFTASMIGASIGRSKNCIVLEIRRNGGRNKYNAIKAQKNAEERNKNRKLKLSQLNQNQTPYFSMRDRIENLEMQVEILSETIKELINASKN